MAHALAVASPGPDFAIVLRQSLAYGRRTAIWTSIGIGSGISLHIAYSLLGIGLLLMGSPTAFSILKYAGAAYLGWLGIQGLRAKKRGAERVSVSDESLTAVRPCSGPELGRGASAPIRTIPTSRSAWVTGFLTNALNPKATLFFVALFPVVVSRSTPVIVRAGYGLWMVFATMGWFCLVSLLFTHERFRSRFLKHGHWIDRALGVVFLTFALGLVVG